MCFDQTDERSKPSFCLQGPARVVIAGCLERLQSNICPFLVAVSIDANTTLCMHSMQVLVEPHTLICTPSGTGTRTSPGLVQDGVSGVSDERKTETRLLISQDRPDEQRIARIGVDVCCPCA